MGSSFDFHYSCKLGLPLISVFKQLGFIVEKFLVQKCRVFEVRSFNDSIDRAGLGAETAENALGHINIILSGSSRAVWSWLGLDDDGKGWAGGLAELAGDASLFTGWVSSEGMLASEHGGEDSLLPWVMNDVIWFEGSPGGHEKKWPGQLTHDQLLVNGFGDISSVDHIWE